MSGSSSFRRIARKAAGVCLIVVGIPGLVLPGLQGIAMIALGLVMLGKEEWVYKTWARCKRIFKRSPHKETNEEERSS